MGRLPETIVHPRLSMVTMMLVVILCIDNVSAELHRSQHPNNIITKRDGRRLKFLVVGDWGRRGDYNQSEVAFQMGRIGEKLDIDFVVSTGDNFYDDGLVGVDDPNFMESFSNVYTAKSLQKQWYNVLGNHDYRGDAVAQLSPRLREIDSRWICSRNYVVNTDLADLVFLDTTPFVGDYFSNPEDHAYDWRQVLPVENYTANVLRDVELALNESKARWKIVIGHHAIRSISHHGDTPELIQRLLPILQANDVDLYINGHDHCLQRITDQESPIQFLTSGAGSKAWRGDVKTANSQGLRFFYDGQGFMSVQLKPNSVKVVFYDVSGKVLHRWTRTKHQLHPLV